jgi:hypothetical protein
VRAYALFESSPSVSRLFKKKPVPASTFSTAKRGERNDCNFPSLKQNRQGLSAGPSPPHQVLITQRAWQSNKIGSCDALKLIFIEFQRSVGNREAKIAS